MPLPPLPKPFAPKPPDIVVVEGTPRDPGPGRRHVLGVAYDVIVFDTDSGIECLHDAVLPRALAAPLASGRRGSWHAVRRGRRLLVWGCKFEEKAHDGRDWADAMRARAEAALGGALLLVALPGAALVHDVPPPVVSAFLVLVGAVGLLLLADAAGALRLLPRSGLLRRATGRLTAAGQAPEAPGGGAREPAAGADRAADGDADGSGAGPVRDTGGTDGR